MNKHQHEQVVKFCKPFYQATGRWHAWDHASAVKKLATQIAKEEFPDLNLLCIQTAAIMHDMGRIVRDEGHAEESGKIAEPFLRAIGIPDNDVDIILDAVTHHDVKKIEHAAHLEARIVYDADKIEILSVYGFWRVAYWLVEERKMELGEAVRFLDEYCKRFQATLYSNFAKKLARDEYPAIQEMIRRFDAYEKKWRA